MLSRSVLSYIWFERTQMIHLEWKWIWEYKVNQLLSSFSSIKKGMFHITSLTVCKIKVIANLKRDASRDCFLLFTLEISVILFSFLYSLSWACVFALSAILMWERPLQSTVILWTSGTCEFDIWCTSALLCYWTQWHIFYHSHKFRPLSPVAHFLSSYVWAPQGNCCIFSFARYLVLSRALASL